MRPNEKKLIKLFGDHCMNLWAFDKEDVHEHAERYFTAEHKRISQAIEQSIGTGKIVKLPDGVTRTRAKLGFEFYVEHLEHEVALVAITDEDQPDRYKYLAASSGTKGRVMLPVEKVLPFLKRRASKKVRTTAMVIHNHPADAIKDWIEENLGFPLGPSGTDRETSLRWRSAFNFTGTSVNIDMLLFESNLWRRISLPPAERLAQTFINFLDQALR